MEKRRIIKEKSIYSRKVSHRNQVLDEIQLKWILFMMRKDETFFCKDVRPNVRVLLEKHGKTVEDSQAPWWKITHNKQEPKAPGYTGG